LFTSGDFPDHESLPEGETKYDVPLPWAVAEYAEVSRIAASRNDLTMCGMVFLPNVDEVDGLVKNILKNPLKRFGMDVSVSLTHD
jgi:hypothetical protein